MCTVHDFNSDGNMTETPVTPCYGQSGLHVGSTQWLTEPVLPSILLLPVCCSTGLCLTQIKN